ncbi:MAG: hypothetical protein GXO78_02925 [Calditrichaeota bacterium]|nr:hypothetical protein [Calditrichota bacterium]
MPLTAIAFMLVFAVGMVATLFNPVFGILLYVFEWHNHPPYMWWGDSVPNLRYPFLIGIVTLISFFLNRHKLRQMPHIYLGPFFWLAILLAWMYIVSFGWALRPDESFRQTWEFTKFVMFYLMIILILRERKHYDWFILTLMLGVANFGRIAYERGSNRYLGVIAPNATEENAISAHVVSTMPYFGTRFLRGNRWLKMFIILSVPFLINLMILANSRGAFVALLMIGAVGFILFPPKEKLKIVLALVAAGVMVLWLANEQFWERQKTTLTPKEEGSAASRFYLWRGAINVIKDYPLGVGDEGFSLLVFDYVPELVPKMQEKGARTVHNTFLLAGVDWGIPGFIMFMGFLIHTFLVIHRLKVRLKRFPALRKIYYYDLISLQLAIIGLLTAGFFTNRLYAEVLYWYAALAVVLANIINRDMEEQAA